MSTPPTPDEGFENPLYPSQKNFTYADILIVPDNQLVLVIFFERTLETIENTCSNNEFHEEKQLFVFVRKYHFVCNLPNFMD